MSEVKYPKGERAWMSYWSRENVLLFLLTSKENNRDWYYLYENVDGTLKKLGKARTPPELEEKYNVIEKMIPKQERTKSRHKKTVAV